VDGAEAPHAGLAEQVLAAPHLTGGDPPRLGIARERELGELVHDHEVLQVLLLRPLEAEADAAVEDPEHEVHPPGRRARLFQHHPKLVKVVADGPNLTPRLLPGQVDAAALRVGDPESALEGCRHTGVLRPRA
jgi:hypothetical protein